MDFYLDRRILTKFLAAMARACHQQHFYLLVKGTASSCQISVLFDYVTFRHQSCLFGVPPRSGVDVLMEASPGGLRTPTRSWPGLLRDTLRVPEEQRVQAVFRLLLVPLYDILMYSYGTVC